MLGRDDGLMLLVAHFDQTRDDHRQADVSTSRPGANPTPEAIAQAVEVLSQVAGIEFVTWATGADDPRHSVLIAKFVDAGSYRRALGSYDAKLYVVPLLAHCHPVARVFEDRATFRAETPATDSVQWRAADRADDADTANLDR